MKALKMRLFSIIIVIALYGTSIAEGGAFYGIISGGGATGRVNGGITKVGSDQLTLGGVNSFNGLAALTEGTVLIANPSALGHGNVILGIGNGSGAVLQTTGGNHTIQVMGNYTQNQDGTLVLNISGRFAGSSDLLTVQGSLTVIPNAPLTLNSSLPPLSTSLVVVLIRSGNISGGGHFMLTGSKVSLGEGTTFNLGANKATINYGTLHGYPHAITLTLVGPNGILQLPQNTRRRTAQPSVPASNSQRFFPTPTPDDPDEWGL